jgi:hypothetical protein
MNVVTASISGENLKSKTNLAKKIGVPRRRLSGGMRIREHVFKSGKSCFKFSKRKIRNDAVSEEDTNLRMTFAPNRKQKGYKQIENRTKNVR